MFLEATFGAPETVTAKLNRSIAKIKTTHLCLGLLPGMAPPIIANHIERFATEVAPNLG